MTDGSITLSALRIALLVTLALLLAWSLLAIGITGPVIILHVPPLTIEVTPSVERLRADVERLCGDLAPRDYRDPEGLRRTAEWIASEMRAAGLTVTVEPYRLREGEYYNVIGRREGRDPTSGLVVVGAHYDAYGGFPGADDNASGVAVLLELMRTLPPRSPHRTQVFAAFSTEEPPFFGSDDMGSYRWASAQREQGTPVDLMIALDLVGYYDDAPGSQHFPHRLLSTFYPDRGNFVAVIGDARSGREIERVKRGLLGGGKLPVHSFRAPAALAPVHLSDHLSFRRLGMPGVLVTDTAFMRYPHYHTRDDTPEKLDYERMAELVGSLHHVLWDGP